MKNEQISTCMRGITMLELLIRGLRLKADSADQHVRILGPEPMRCVYYFLRGFGKCL